MTRASTQVAFESLAVLYQRLLTNRDFEEMTRIGGASEIAEWLTHTWYRDDMRAASAFYAPPESIEVATGMHLLRTNESILKMVPRHGRNLLLAYLAKWDIENIELILAAKGLGRALEWVDPFLVTDRKTPVGIAGATIPHGTLRFLLEQQSIESVATYLLPYGYGSVLLQHLEEYEATGD
ncbi:MAG: V-type ATPase subunit, partial [Nitrososphaerota archaeon]|nr:V-type ATPase subunit [Nitrososphaerota archaeon]